MAVLTSFRARNDHITCTCASVLRVVRKARLCAACRATFRDPVCHWLADSCGILQVQLAIFQRDSSCTAPRQDLKGSGSCSDAALPSSQPAEAPPVRRQISARDTASAGVSAVRQSSPKGGVRSRPLALRR